MAEKLPQAADQAGEVLTTHADSAAAAIQDKGQQVATGMRDAGQELGKILKPYTKPLFSLKFVIVSPVI